MIGRALARIGSLLVKAGEGEYRPGPYYLPLSGGWLSAEAGSFMNWWQLGHHLSGGGSSQSAMVEACVSAYAQTVAMCPGSHWQSNDKGGRDRITNSALSRFLRRPNEYQSISDFMLNTTRSLYLHGNAYGLALRNNRNEITEIHLMDPRMSRPQVAVTGDVFYHLGGNDIIAQQIPNEQLIVPMRDVLHIRLHTLDRRKRPFPLVGDTPLTAALSNIVTTEAMTKQQLEFYQNQARPSAVLTTDLPLDRETVQHLRDRWNEQAKGLDGCGPGGTPILTHGIKVMPWAQAGKDTQIADMFKLNDEKIALAFRIPLQVLGLGSASHASVETLMHSWVAQGLGFCLNHVEEGFGVLFELGGQPDDYLEFDTAALLRSAFKDRIEALARGVQGGIYSPNEARNMEGLDNVKFGDEPRVQQQVVPLSAAAGIMPAVSGPHPPPAPPAGGPGTAKPDKPTEDNPPPEKDHASHVRHIRPHAIFRAADQYDRQRVAERA